MEMRVMAQGLPEFQQGLAVEVLTYPFPKEPFRGMTTSAG